MNQMCAQAGGRSLCNFWTGCTNFPSELVIRNPDVESFRLVHVWVQSEGGGSGTPLQILIGPLLRNFKYIVGILSSSTVDWYPF